MGLGSRFTVTVMGGEVERPPEEAIVSVAENVPTVAYTCDVVAPDVVSTAEPSPKFQE